ncbi:methylated-DNA--[protein]-cysteine S-methyltransferase [Pseudolactococcus laudensis]|uniref:methylated-DNA--[protein]-cysteine S-methyltransferase n=1 Tax=Pseudolactococcus laudensis TaxID=1494461 RepID=UPI003F994075
MYDKTKYRSPIATITLASDGQNIIGLWLEGQKYHGETLFEEWVENDCLPVFKLAKNWLDQYFAGEAPKISDLPLAPIGSKFRQDVWCILREIPYGQVITYGEIADKIAVKQGKTSMSSQAVVGAVGHNPISIIIPCHRVVGTNGSLIGYAGGIANKVKLLELEGVEMTRLFVPKETRVARNT